MLDWVVFCALMLEFNYFRADFEVSECAYVRKVIITAGLSVGSHPLSSSFLP